MVRDASATGVRPSRRGDGWFFDAVRYDQQVVLLKLRSESVVLRLESQNECFEFRDASPQSLIVVEETGIATDKTHESLRHECKSFKVGRCSATPGPNASPRARERVALKRWTSAPVKGRTHPAPGQPVPAVEFGLRPRHDGTVRGPDETGDTGAARPVRAWPCQSICVWEPTGEVWRTTTYDDLRVFACRGCGSEWVRTEPWTPVDCSGTVPAGVAEEASRR